MIPTYLFLQNLESQTTASFLNKTTHSLFLSMMTNLPNIYLYNSFFLPALFFTHFDANSPLDVTVGLPEDLERISLDFFIPLVILLTLVYVEKHWFLLYENYICWYLGYRNLNCLNHALFDKFFGQVVVSLNIPIKFQGDPFSINLYFFCRN